MDELRIETTPAFADIQFLDVRAYREALAKRDVTTLDDIWADDYTFTNPHGDFLTKKQRLENIRSAHTQIESVGSEDQDVRVYGDTAVITGRVTLKGKYSGKEARWTTRRGRAVRPRRRGSRAEPPTVLGCRLCGATQVAAVQVSVARLSAATVNPDARPDLKDDVCVNRISGFE